MDVSPYELIANGYFIFPVRPYDGTSEESKAACKAPMPGVLWRREATRERAQIDRWRERWPDCRWGIHCGESGVVVVDLDEGVKHGRVRAGRAAWKELGQVDDGSDGASTVDTVGGGRHLFYGEGRALVGPTTGAVAPDVDTRGLFGMVVAYGVPGPVATLPVVPDVVVDRVRKAPVRPLERPPEGTGRLDAAGRLVVDPFTPASRTPWAYETALACVNRTLADLAAAQPGGRNDALNRAAFMVGQFCGEAGFWQPAVVAGKLAEIARDIGLRESEIHSTIRSGLGRGTAEAFECVADASYQALRGSDAGSAGDGDAASPVDALLAEMVDTDGLETIGDLEPLVKGWLSRNTVARINGKSTHGKSFVTLDLAGHVGTGREWRGARVHQGPVVYVIAEGAQGFRKRVRAWEKYTGQRMTGVRFLPRPVQVTGSEWGTLTEACKRIEPVLIVLDTQARVTTGVNENDNTEMGAVLAYAEELRRATGACVLFVHHLGHNGEEGRGATAIKAGVQTELLCVRDDKDVVTLSLPKQKDDADDMTLRFAMHVMEVGRDEDGSAITSVVMIDPSSFIAQAMRQEDWGDHEHSEATVKLVGLFKEVFDKGRGGTKAEVKSIAVARKMPRATFFRAWGRLEEEGIIARVGETQSWKIVPIESRSTESHDQSHA